ncbi:hypothetical protein C1646_678018 [Rhizophagus diaphanus]|nr:hypothetical protein C1646_678018 [Rhizophagus diaphanus] [Rhizophagus sp. MUCL 43196]
MFDHRQNEFDEWEWSSHWRYLNSINKGRCDNFGTNDTLINFVKMNLLPTVDNLRKRNDIYKDFSCPMCRDHDETLKHSVICSGSEQGVILVEEEVTNKIWRYLKRFKCNRSFTIMDLNCSIFEYCDPAFPELKQRNRCELLKGLISHTIIKKLRIFTSRSITRSITLKIIKRFHTAFRELVWKP